MKIKPIKMTVEEERYALALSKRLPYKCPRPEQGSVAHALKALLHMQAKKEGIKLTNSSVYFVQ
jgi:hypothetical protein